MLSFFDVIGFLEDYGIEYSESGSKNVAQGWLGITCFACDDSSNHLGINLDSKLISCWKCGYKSSVHSVIMHYTDCSFKEAEQLISENQEFTQRRNKLKKIRKDTGSSILPKTCSFNMPFRFVSFLKNRRFCTDIIKKYDLRSQNACGEYKNRFIIPISINHEIVSFTSLDITGKQKPKYKHASSQNSIIPAKECVYGLDLVSDRMLLVEGITDAWRMGPGAVATLGMELSKTQINFIAQAPQQEIFIMFDGEKQAIKNAHRLAKTLSMLGKSVEVIELSSGDPDQLTNKMVVQVRRSIGL